MNSKAKAVRNEILTDMNYVKNTLTSVESVIRSQKGVGCEFCADEIQTIIERYSVYYRTIQGLS